MSVMGNDFEADGNVVRFPAPSVSDTYWGYTITEAEDEAKESDLASPLMRFLGLVLILSAYGQWLLPGSFFSGDVFLTKASLAAVLAMTGIGIYWFASRGTRQVVAVDLSRRQVRVAKRNGSGDERLRLVQPMDRIEGAVLKRAADPEIPSELFLRLKGRKGPVLIAVGEEDDLLRLHRRLAEDMRPMRERVEDRLSADPGFRSVRRLGF